MDEIEGKGSEEGLERINIKVPCRSFFFSYFQFVYYNFSTSHLKALVDF